METALSMTDLIQLLPGPSHSRLHQGLVTHKERERELDLSSCLPRPTAISPSPHRFHKWSAILYRVKAERDLVLAAAHSGIPLLILHPFTLFSLPNVPCLSLDYKPQGKDCAISNFCTVPSKCNCNRRQRRRSGSSFPLFPVAFRHS